MSSDERTLIVFDVETTGIRKDQDQIIELSTQQGLGTEAPRKSWRIKPSVPISPGAQRVHGISMDDLKDCEPFSTHADELRRVFEKADVIVGYNVSFDLDMLQTEFQRIGLPLVDFSKKLIVDPLRLWQRMEPRTLQDAHRRFVGSEFDEAHSADADIAATASVLQGMLKEFDLEGESWERLANICDPGRKQWIGPSRHVKWQEGVPVITFGKHAGRSLSEIAAGPDASYLKWIVGADFPEHVKRVCQAATQHDPDAFVKWVTQEFAPPPDECEPS